MPDLDEWITRQSLEECAGPKVFERGEAYFDHGAVSRLRDSGSKVSARVEGTENYRAELWTDGQELAYDCTCPHAEEGNFCKHCVALGLAFLAEREAGGFPEFAEERESWPRLRQYLLLQPPETLVNWLLDAAQMDDRLHQHLLLEAERSSGAVDRAKALRREIERAARSGDADALDELADALEELLEPESAAFLVDLAEYAIRQVEAAQERLESQEYDDYEEYDEEEDGADLSSVLERLAELHLEACAMARPDPELLAERLFRYETTAGSGVFQDSARRYEEALGPSGLRRYRELAEQAWREVPPLEAEGQRWDDEPRQVARVMETLAQRFGDIDDLAAVKSRDLSSSYRYLEIARLDWNGGRLESALDWAERGMKAFPDRLDSGLRNFAVDAYLEQGRGEDALRLAWAQFAERPELGNYRTLHGVATRLGAWSALREKALAEVAVAAQRAADAAAQSRWRTGPVAPDQTERVRIALWEQDPDSGWQVAQLGPCQQDVLIGLARQLEAARPADAAALYQRLVPDILATANNRAYEEAVALLGKIGGLMRGMGQAGQFADYLAELRTRHRQKRNLMKLLDAANLG
jgi:uncharacterized Zn finger protein